MDLTGPIGALQMVQTACLRYELEACVSHNRTGGGHVGDVDLVRLGVEGL